MRRDLARLEGTIIKGIVVVLAVFLGLFGGGAVLAMRDPSSVWRLLFLVPACVVDLWLAIGALKVLYKKIS